MPAVRVVIEVSHHIVSLFIYPDANGVGTSCFSVQVASDDNLACSVATSTDTKQRVPCQNKQYVYTLML